VKQLPALFFWNLAGGEQIRDRNKREKRVRVNDQIRIAEVRVIDSDGTQLGVLATPEAKKLAEERDLDLVEIAPNVRPPVCKIMDYGKYKYEQSKKARESKKKQHVTHLKEIKIRPKIEEHDLQVKMQRAERFLRNRDRVKFTVIFRGREMEHIDIGQGILDRIVKDFSDFAVIEKEPVRVGRLISMIMSPRSDR
jgi:translation initiation factor IF-3